MIAVPGPAVLAAFGVAGAPVRLPGGSGGSFAVGDVVLRREQVSAWATVVADVMAAVMADAAAGREPVSGFRVPEPLTSRDGRWVVGGWSAWARVAGEHRGHDTDWPAALEVARSFTTALGRVAVRLPARATTNVYRRADIAAWTGPSLPAQGALGGLLGRLAAVPQPAPAPVQLVHVDLAGNLLWAAALPPAVIDLTPYERPAGYGVAMVVVDAVLWYGADIALTEHAADVPELARLVARGLAFRLGVSALGAAGSRWRPASLAHDVAAAEPLVAWVEQHA